LRYSRRFAFYLDQYQRTTDSKEDKAIFNCHADGERAFIGRCDKYIADHVNHDDHLKLLQDRREGIR